MKVNQAVLWVNPEIPASQIIINRTYTYNKEIFRYTP